MSFKFFNKIPVDVSEERIYKRLGYYKKITKISVEQRKQINFYIADAVGLLNLKAVTRVLPIVEKSYPTVIMVDKISFKSRLFFSLLKNSSEVLFMAVTAGKKVSKAISKFKEIDFVRSIVYDAVASEYVDACFDWLANYFSQKFKRENKVLTKKRISCGYFDFSLEYQRAIFRILKLKRLGISLTKKNMLIPEKSATAVMGIIKLVSESGKY